MAREDEDTQHHDPADDAEDLPQVTTIPLDVKTPRGKRYVGTFHFKVPNLADQVEIGRLKAERLPNGAGGDVQAFLLAEQICFLTVCLQKPIPEWWRPWDLYDELPVRRLYAEAFAYHRRFLGIDRTTPANTPDAAERGDNPEPGALAPAHGARPSVPVSPKRQTIISSERTGSD